MSGDCLIHIFARLTIGTITDFGFNELLLKLSPMDGKTQLETLKPGMAVGFNDVSVHDTVVTGSTHHTATHRRLAALC